MQSRFRLSAITLALFFSGRTGCPLFFEQRKGRRHAQFRQPTRCRPRKRHVWGQRQSRWPRTADGFAVFEAAFLCRASQSATSNSDVVSAVEPGLFSDWPLRLAESSAPPEMLVPNLHRWGKRQSRRLSQHPAALLFVDPRQRPCSRLPNYLF